MLIDTNAYIGHWPFRKLVGNTPDGLDAIAKKAGITHMFVASLNAVFYKDVMQGNLELYEEVKCYKGETTLVPFAIVNPTYPAWREDMIRCVKELGFKGIELCPMYQGYFAPYKLAKEGAEAFKLAGELGVPVRICAEFEDSRQHHRLDIGACFPDADDIAEMLDASEKTTLILTGFSPFRLSQKLIEKINARDNVFVDISRTEHFTSSTWAHAMKNYGVKHMCYGTLSPFYYAETTLVRLHFADLSPEEIDAIRFGNLKKYID